MTFEDSSVSLVSSSLAISNFSGIQICFLVILGSVLSSKISNDDSECDASLLILDYEETFSSDFSLVSETSRPVSWSSLSMSKLNFSVLQLSQSSSSDDSSDFDSCDLSLSSLMNMK